MEPPRGLTATEPVTATAVTPSQRPHHTAECLNRRPLLPCPKQSTGPTGKAITSTTRHYLSAVFGATRLAPVGCLPNVGHTMWGFTTNDSVAAQTYNARVRSSPLPQAPIKTL